jgi:hypothetical protein
MYGSPVPASGPVLAAMLDDAVTAGLGIRKATEDRHAG